MLDKPPVFALDKTNDLNFLPLDNCLNSRKICTANSRVGVMTMTRGPALECVVVDPFLPLPFFFGFFKMDINKGNKKAQVLPMQNQKATQEQYSRIITERKIKLVYTVWACLKAMNI